MFDTGPVKKYYRLLLGYHWSLITVSISIWEKPIETWNIPAGDGCLPRELLHFIIYCVSPFPEILRCDKERKLVIDPYLTPSEIFFGRSFSLMPRCDKKILDSSFCV